MNAQERLRRLRGLGVHKGVVALPPPHRRRGPAIEELIEGELVETELGRCFVSEQVFAPDHVHGRVRLADLPGRSTEVASRLAHDPSLAALDFGRAAFIDTETTGLAGGTGTVAFLVGIGFFEGDGFHVRQYFMRDYPEEISMLKVLGESLQRFGGVVSFNGKAFDMPLLATRFITARMRPRLQGAPHWDLLFPSRRLWRDRLDSCALSSLEVHILGLRRTQADVTGGMIPQLYFDYLRSGDAGEMARVFYHNAMDIVSMAALSTHILDLVQHPLAGGARHASDYCSLGRLYEEAGMRENAEECYRCALARPATDGRRDLALRRLAMLHKRAGQGDAARDIWRTLVEERGEARLEALVELAKEHEHRLRDYVAAQRYVALATEEVSAWPPGPDRRAALAELHHRSERLQRKAERETARSEGREHEPGSGA